MTDNNNEEVIEFSDQDGTAPKDLIYEEVKRLLEAWDTAFQEDPEDSYISRIIYEEKLPDLIDSVTVIMVFRDELMQVTTKYQHAVPVSKSADILNYMNYINSRLEYGSFTLIDDHITFRTHLSFDDMTKVSMATLSNTIQKGIDSFYDFGDGFARILRGDTTSVEENLNALNFTLLSTVTDYIADEDFDEYDVHHVLQQEWLPTLFYNLEYTRDFLEILDKNGANFLSSALRGAFDELEIEADDVQYDVSKNVSDDGITHFRITLPENEEDDLCLEIHLLCTADIALRQYFMIMYDGTENRRLIASLLPDPDDMVYYSEAENDPAINAAAIEELFHSENGI